MKTKAAKERDRKQRQARGQRAAETLAKTARGARAKWNKPNRRRAREQLDEVSDGFWGYDGEFETNVSKAVLQELDAKPRSAFS